MKIDRGLAAGRKVVMITGTGRCGSKSAVTIVNSSPQVNVTHEERRHLPWEPDFERAEVKIENWFKNRKEEIVGDTGFFWLNYLEEMLKAIKGMRVVCLKRSRASVVESFHRWCVKDRVDWWRTTHRMKNVSSNELYNQFPHYDVEGLREAIGMYWDDFYIQIEELHREWPEQVKIWDTEDLNDLKKIRGILDFMGVPRHYQAPPHVPVHHAW